METIVLIKLVIRIIISISHYTILNAKFELVKVQMAQKRLLAFIKLNKRKPRFFKW